MCGIFFISKSYKNCIQDNFNLGKNRGPDNSYFEELKNYYIGFHRLSINGLNNKSNQPFIKEDIYVICNGEIYNFKELYNIINVEPETDSDCEIIIDLYLAGFEIDQICKLLDGVFAFIIYDYKTDEIFSW